jgi:hypothetical protein
MFSRLYERCAEKPTFLKVAAILFGVPFATAVLWKLGPCGGIGWWLFLLALAALTAWLWALEMWLFCAGDIQRRAAHLRARRGRAHDA